jgi:two-component system alkaline phosphatase synthesis response regulator PhoP
MLRERGGLLESVKILIADDEPYIVRSLSFIFQREGIPFDVAKDGQEAIEKAKRLKPKILFLDIMMPLKSGLEVCALIKQDPELRSIHIIMLTAKGQEDDKQKSRSVGADDYITKPFSPRQVLERVKKILEGRLDP